MKSVRKDINRLSSLVNQIKSSEGSKKSKQKKKRGRKKKANPSFTKGVTTAINHISTMAGIIESLLGPQLRGSQVFGLPTFPNNSSIKCKSVQEVEITTGTGNGNLGVLAIAPSLSNQNFSLVVSGSAWAGTAVPAINSAAGGLTGSGWATLPYNNAAFGVNLAGRVISIGIETWYTGTFSNCGGTIYMIAHPTWGDLTGDAVSDLATYKEAIVSDVAMGEHFHYATHPPSRALWEYGTATLPTGSTATPIAVLFKGAAAGVTFHARVTQLVEYTGETAECLSTPNPITPAGAMDHVLQVATKVKEDHTKVPRASIMDLVEHGKYLYSLASGIKVGGKPLLSTANVKKSAGALLMAGMSSLAL